MGPRLRSGGLSPADALLTVTNHKGRPFHVRIVRSGDRYGLDDRLVYPDPKNNFERLKAAAGDVMIEFYDASQDPKVFGERGQFVSRYYLSTLEDHGRRGLTLNGAVEEWTVTAGNVAEAVAFARSAPGSSVRVGPRLRSAEPVVVPGEWVPFGPFGKQVRTGTRVRITKGADAGRIGAVNAERDSTMETAFSFSSGPGLGETSPDPDSGKGRRRRVRWYGVVFDDGVAGVDGYLYPRDHLSWQRSSPADPPYGFPSGSSGSSVRVGLRLRAAAPSSEPAELWIRFGRSPVITGMRVKISALSGIDSGKIGTVTQKRSHKMSEIEYGVDLGDAEVYVWPKSRLLRLQPAPLVDRNVKLARVRFVHKISQSDKDVHLFAVAPGDLDTFESILRWLKGNGHDAGLGRGTKWRKEPDGRIVLFFGRGFASWHSLIIEPISPGSPNTARPTRSTTELTRRLEPLRAAMEDAFSCTTAFGTCKTDKPSSGHCMLAAMVVQDVFGGCILHAKVDAVPHYWNRVDDLEVDLTGDQFGKPSVRVGPRGSLYPGSSVFPRDPKKSLVPSLNADLLVRHRRFVDALAPAMRRQGLDRDAAHVTKIVNSWPVMTRAQTGSSVRVGPRLRPNSQAVVEPEGVGIGPGIRFGDDIPRPFEERPFFVFDERLTIDDQGNLYLGSGEVPIEGAVAGSVAASLFGAKSKHENELYWKTPPDSHGRKRMTEAILSAGHGFGIRIRLRRIGGQSFAGVWGDHVFPWVSIRPNLIRIPHMRTGRDYLLLDRRGGLWTGDADAASIVEIEAVPI